MSSKICFLDRDGVINYDFGYVGTIKRFEWIPEIFEILRLLKSIGYKFVLVTNQSGLSRKYYSLHDFYHLSFWMLNELHRNGIGLEINYCPHCPSDLCKCRKPLPAMINRYQSHPNHIIIGDKDTDMVAGLSANIPNRWLISNEPPANHSATFVFKSHNQLLNFIKSTYLD